MPTPDYLEIPLTRGQVAKVSPEDFERMVQFSWYAQWNIYTNSFYAWRRNGTKAVTMHSFILGAEADHINHDTLNNLRHNLRPANAVQQGANRRLFKNSTSGFKGVSRCGDRWRAYIQPGGRMHHLGVFTHKEDAARAYDKAAIAYFGEFAHTNFPLSTYPKEQNA